MSKLNILMIGAGRNVQGGVSTVVNQYYTAGLDTLVNLQYVPTMLDGSKAKKLKTAFKAYIQFSKLINYADIVHVHMSHRASFFRKKHFIDLAYKRGKKIIIHLHGSEFDVFYEKECNSKQRKMVKDTFGKADAVIALSEEWRDWLLKICPREKIKVLYNAINLPKFKREAYEDKNVLFLGRLGKRKGTYDLLEAIPGVLKVVPDAKFFLGGDGDVEECKKIVCDKHIENAVSFLGWITPGNGKEEYLEKCSTFILPSYHEGMPMSILEAMSYGEIVISTYVGGIPKVIENGINGYLVEAGDVHSITDILISVLTEENRLQIGERAYDTIEENFNAKKNIDKLIDIYNEI